MAHRFQIVREIRREYSRFNTIGTQKTVRLNTPTYPEINPVDHFLASVNDLFEHALQDVGDADTVGFAIHNEVNESDRPIDISFKRQDQLSVDAIWSVFEVIQSNSRFNALDTLTVVLHSVKMPVGFGFHSAGMKTKGRPLLVMAHLKSIIQVKTEKNCLAHALIIAIAKLTNNPNYKAYIQGRKIYRVVSNPFYTTSINLENAGGIPEDDRFHDHFRQYRIVVYAGLNCDDIM